MTSSESALSALQGLDAGAMSAPAAGFVYYSGINWPVIAGLAALWELYYQVCIHRLAQSGSCSCMAVACVYRILRAYIRSPAVPGALAHVLCPWCSSPNLQ